MKKMQGVPSFFSNFFNQKIIIKFLSFYDWTLWRNTNGD